ncbi:MAG: dihydrodipicolinate synthase family protein [Pirellulales bacterium]
MTKPSTQPSTARLPAGSYPAMLTAFHDDGRIDWDGVSRLTDKCIEAGASGIFACGLSAEVLQMDDDEKVQLAEHIIRRTAGRIPIVAAGGHFRCWHRKARDTHHAGARRRCRSRRYIGVSHLADEQCSDEEWIA